MKKFALVLTLALAVAVPAAAGGKTYLGGCSPQDHAKFKPHHVLLACGDGSLYVNHIKWRSWGKKRARGHGRAHVNDCTPSCAQGRFHTYPARLKLRHRVTCDVGPRHQFTHVRLIFSGQRPAADAPRAINYTRPCSRR